MMPAAGDIVHLGKGCGVPWEWTPTLFRVIGVQDSTTWEGMAFIDGYELHPETGQAVERRSVYVQVAGIRQIPTRQPAKQTPAIPKQRTPKTRVVGRPR